VSLAVSGMTVKRFKKMTVFGGRMVVLLTQIGGHNVELRYRLLRIF
jgi:hypothetical protein